MTKIKTSELTGPALDWAVAKCEGLDILGADVSTGEFYWDDDGLQWSVEWEPTTNWAQGGPLIEREKITVHIGWPDEQPLASIWTVRDKSGFAAFKQRGPTPLIAAMRCLVASKLGDVVDIPKELT